MTAVALPHPVAMTPWGGAVPMGSISTSLGSDATFTFDAAGDKLYCLFQALSTTVPDQITFRVTGAGTPGSAGNIEATLENVTAGVPSGAVTNSATGSSAINSTGVKTITGMAGTATISIGTIYAVVLTAGSGWNRSLALLRTTGTAGGIGFPISGTKDSAGAYSLAGTQNCGIALSLADSGGTYLQIPGLLGAYTASFQSFSNATNPDERGNIWVHPVPQKIIGAIFIANGGSSPGANDDFSIRLYSGSGASPTPVADSGTMEGEAQGAQASNIRIFTNGGYEVSAGESLRLTFRAEGTDSASMVRWAWSANSELAAIMGTGFYSTTCNNAGSFTDDNTMMYSIWPIFSTADDGTGGAGGGVNRAILPSGLSAMG